MFVIINGKKIELHKAKDIAGLLDELKLKRDAVAVELNKAIVKRTQFNQTHLEDGDILEIVHLVGGGAEPQKRKIYAISR